MKFIAAAGAFSLLVLFTVPAQAICLWDCRPTESDARSVFEKSVRRMSGGAPFKIESFEKTNGQDMNMMGMEGYVMDVTAVVIFPQGVNTECLKGRGNSFSMKCIGLATGADRGLVLAPGARKTFSSRVGFQKTERGWRGDDGVIY
jgi:hypothetical protein